MSVRSRKSPRAPCLDLKASSMRRTMGADPWLAARQSGVDPQSACADSGAPFARHTATACPNSPLTGSLAKGSNLEVAAGDGRVERAVVLGIQQAEHALPGYAALFAWDKCSSFLAKCPIGGQAYPPLE